MSRFLILTDSKDNRLGEYFRISADDLMKNSDFPSDSFVHLYGNQLNDVRLDVISETENESFSIVVTYCHGYYEGFSYGNNQVLFNAQSRIIKQFKGAIIYSVSCSSGKIFGPEAIECGAECFIGYKNEVIVLLEFLAEYVKCTNSGVHQLINGSSADVAFRAIKHQFGRLMKGLDFIDESVINDNIDQLVILGNRGTTLK